MMMVVPIVYVVVYESVVVYLLVGVVFCCVGGSGRRGGRYVLVVVGGVVFAYVVVYMVLGVVLVYMTMELQICSGSLLTLLIRRYLVTPSLSRRLKVWKCKWNNNETSLTFCSSIWPTKCLDLLLLKQIDLPTSSFWKILIIKQQTPTSRTGQVWLWMNSKCLLDW